VSDAKDASGSSAPGRWTRVDDLFHRAIEMDAARRDEFLDRECGDDHALRAEVSSLIAAHEESAQFLEQPAVAPSLISGLGGTEAHEEPSLEGRTIGPYSVQRPLGRGGMGVVYLAHDARLDRTVAIKVLASRFTRDSVQRERLRREARLAAGLSYPGIATIYALEEFDDQLIIVSEYIEGRTLRDELADGPLAPDRAVATSLAIAEALAAAHERGVLHRDLKPENVMRTRDGRIKILDFGLARLVDRAPDEAAASRLTVTGALLGTPAYMAPEQLRGLSSDARADVFAWGMLAYELAAGRHAFAPTDADQGALIVGILEREPASLSELQLSLPAAFVDVVTRSLAKDVSARPATAAAVVAALRGAAPQQSASQEGHPAKSAPLSLWWWRFHQLATSCVYCAMLVPLWLIRPWLPAHWGSTVFVLALAAVLAATILRLHLWFSSRVYPHEWAAQRGRASGWIHLADLCFVGLLGLTGIALLEEHDIAASLVIAVGIAALLAATIIEPATTRAAFRE
jgi:serine/threonine protein kinase